MTKEEAIKYLQQLYPNGGHCWLDEQRIEAISMAVKALQEEPVNIWHDASEKPKEENKPIAIKLHSYEVWSPYIVKELSQGWDVFRENVDIKEWAYIDDLFKL